MPPLSQMPSGTSASRCSRMDCLSRVELAAAPPPEIHAAAGRAGSRQYASERACRRAIPASAPAAAFPCLRPVSGAGT